LITSECAWTCFLHPEVKAALSSKTPMSNEKSTRSQKTEKHYLKNNQGEIKKKSSDNLPPSEIL